ncbi:hypothetical protein [Streptomyces sp. NBC_01431]|uniref:hypothetical protein n=1 Tax=Streptomyces sp. NBC_01431 TaxID=2903863 RepID=UPI002E37BAE7|nr:hypothetical protein [Streptomyces sp. NBC_01431]
MRTRTPWARRRHLGSWSKLLASTALATSVAITVTGSGVQPLAGAQNIAAADEPPAGYDLDAAAKVRQDQCRLDFVLRKGGDEMKSVARGGLNGTDAELATAADPQYWQGTALSAAYKKDHDAGSAKMDELYGRNDVWKQSLNQEPPAGYATVAAFQDPPGMPGDKTPSIFEQTGYSGWIADQFWTSEDDFYKDLTPLANQASADAVTALAKARYYPETSANYDDRRAFEDMTFMHGMYADDARIVLQNGGFPTSAPDPDTMEFRVDVENLKARFASCASQNPPDPHHVLGPELVTASIEWQAELAAQKGPRDTILAAEAQADKDLQVATQAMGESLGQSLIASRLADWQAYWLKADPAKAGLSYPKPADFAKVKVDIANARARATGRLFVASRAALDAKAQAAAVDTAQQAAYAIADKAGTPRGRGLLYGQQAAQIAKASAAAALAAAKATETASNATRASAADSKTLNALAMTQAHASKAEFRRKAAEEAAAQAKAAADGAALQAKLAADNATKAKAAQAKAEAAESTAKDAAADAHTKRATAEAERDKAAAERATADSERAKAADAEARAQTQQAAASTARQNAETAGATASSKRADAEAAELRAYTARNDAATADRNRDATTARANALEAAAAAAEGTAAAGETRQAATEARTAANTATTAATSARAAANDAGAASQAADAAATRAEGAAARSQAAADDAAADAATTHAAVQKAHAAAADAIEASEAAAQNVKNAEALAKESAQQAVTARTNATAARVEATAAAATAVQTAGFAYATAQAATAARDSALQVVKPANDAIELGSPYKETDSSAGLAVLTGQAAKTAAQQQEAVAGAKADQAARAAVEAKALADKADADAKAAATAAAAAADSAARAAVSVKEARASAAEASAAAKAAQKAEANTVEYDRQANEDALFAQQAATTAGTDATAARSSATDAEQSASGARTAATAAENDASSARATATTAENDATAAETAAANADADAKDADASADHAEAELRAFQEQQRAAELAASKGDGGTGNAGADLTADEEQALRQECGQACVDEFRKALADSNKSVIDWVIENGGQVLLDVVGVTDAKRCFSSGDVESCLWTLVNVASLVAVLGKIPAVSKAIVSISSGLSDFFRSLRIAEQTVERFRALLRTKIVVSAHMDFGPYKVLSAAGENIVNLKRAIEAGGFTWKFNTGHSFYRAHSGPQVLNDFRKTNLNPDDVEKAIMNDVMTHLGQGGKLPRPGEFVPDRLTRIGGVEIGYKIIQVSDDMLAIGTYWPGP